MRPKWEICPTQWVDFERLYEECLHKAAISPPNQTLMRGLIFNEQKYKYKIQNTNNKYEECLRKAAMPTLLTTPHNKLTQGDDFKWIKL